MFYVDNKYTLKKADWANDNVQSRVTCNRKKNTPPPHTHAQKKQKTKGKQ